MKLIRHHADPAPYDSDDSPGSDGEAMVTEVPGFAFAVGGDSADDGAVDGTVSDADADADTDTPVPASQTRPGRVRAGDGTAAVATPERRSASLTRAEDATSGADSDVGAVSPLRRTAAQGLRSDRTQSTDVPV